MDRLIALLEGPACQHLVTALLHTLWQGAVIAAVLFGVLSQLSATQANKRYICALVALCGMVFSTLLTWSILNYEPAKAQVTSSTTISSTQTVQQEAVSNTPVAPQTTTASTSQPAARQSWHTWALGVWLMGTVLMLMRMAMTLVGARQLRAQCHNLEEPEILSLIESLCSQMQVTRHVRVLVSEHVSVPGVIGCIWPTLLLPVSVTTGMPVDDLKAILTHELAHIKRYDYLVNVIQMLIEALLFFNPAVWWISRQIRIEREACCDAASIASTGQRLKYAEVLVAWTAQLRQDTLAAGVMGFAGQEDSSHLVDRIKRIILIEHRPRLNISWPMAGITIGLSLICLIALWQGTNLAVSVAARILTPQERIEKLTEISKTYGYEPGLDDKVHNIQVSGIIRTWDGSPLPDRIRVLLDATSGQNSSISDIGAKKLDAKPDMAEFHTTVPYGQFEIMASAKGHAPAPAGPYDSEPGKDIDNIELVLQKGFTGQIQVIDEAGRPIAQARLKGGYPFKYNQSCVQSIELSTTAEGLCAQEHTSNQPMTLRVTAPGYEPRSVQSIALDPNRPFVIVLQNAQPITGTVVSRETSLPINHAEIRLLRIRNATHSLHLKQVDSDPDVFTDKNGFFALEQVQQGWQHMIHVTAEGYGHVYLEDLPAGQQGLRIELGPKKVLRGTVLGDLSQLERDAAGQPAIAFQNRYTGYGALHATSPVISKDNISTFVINDVWGQTILIEAGYKEIILKPEEDDLDNVVVDLRSSITREVVLKFEVPDDMPPIQGQVRIDRVTHRDSNRMRSKPEWVDIIENRISFKSSAPGQFRYGLDFYRKLPVGYWFKKSDYIDVAIGTEPMVINVPVYPAGGIYGKILRADGTLAKEARASLRVIKWPDNMEISHGDRSSLTNALSNRVNLGTYNAAPLPLGGTYAIMAYEGCTISMTDPFMLDQTKPMIEADLQLPKGETLTGRVLDPDGKPATSTVRLYISVNHGKASLGRSDMETQPDKNGQFVFENVNPGPGGSSEVLIVGQAGYRPVKQIITDLSKPVVIQLKTGHRVTGTVIDQGTGWPVPGVEVNASVAQNAQGDYASNWEFLKAEAKTDAQGKFQFTNMDTCFYRLNTQGANLAFPNRPLVVKGGQTDTVTVPVALPSWSELKPTKPE